MFLTLWTSLTCPYAQRARIALEECGATYEVRIEDLSNKSDDFLAVYERANPGGRAKVPVLEDGALAITESLVVLQYIVDTLWPLSPQARAQASLAIENSPFGFSGNFREKCEIFERHIRGPFILGDFSFADAALAPFVVRCCIFYKHFKDTDVDDLCQDLPKVRAYIAAIHQRPSVQATTPSDDVLITAMAKIVERIGS